MKYKIYLHPFIAVLAAILFAMVAGTTWTHAEPLHMQTKAQQESTQYHAETLRENTAPTPFMHRPYYGSQTILQRTVSFVDHDKPWYVDDGVFVRYDGARWTNVSVFSCSPGVNCYDGHNGYDLNLHFEPVLSVAAGTVIRAGWYDPLDHNSAFGLWAAIDHGNGYVTVYGHLSALTVAVGNQVGTQWQIGTSGTTGASTGPHLHMGTYYYPSWSATDPFGWTGNYPDPNVVPDYYLWVSDPGTSTTVPLLSANGSNIYPGATLVDDGAAGWSSTGTWNTATSSADIKGNLHWTYTTAGSATATATWQPQLSADGYYEAGAFVDSTYASSSWAPYTIYSADPNHPGAIFSHAVYVDESHIGVFQGPFGSENTGPQWVGLGTYYFKAGLPCRVVLSNATGENGAQVAADGVEFAPVSVQSNPPPTPVYSFTIPADGTSTALQPNGTNNATVTFQNSSNFTWSAGGSTPVQVVYRWLNAQNQVVATGKPAALPHDVPVNTSVAVTVPMQAPAQVGAYLLQWDMLQGSVVFSQKGAQVKDDAVIVSATIPPTLPTTYYFAEGYTGLGTNESLSLMNPAFNPATITITYFYQNAPAQTRTYTVAAQSHSVLNINQEAGTNLAAGMIVQGNQPFVAERTMYTQKDGFVAATDSIGSPLLSTTWYFAEGNTTYGWSTLLAVLNPAMQPTTLKLTYFLNATAKGGSTEAQGGTYTIPARSRATIVLNQDIPNQQFGFLATTSSPVAIERPEYLVQSPVRGGSDVFGAMAPQTHWYFGAGNTSTGFTERLVLTNTASAVASTQIRYLLTNGQIITQNISEPALSRVEVDVNAVVSGQSHAIQIVASVPIVAERQDFFTTPAFVGSTTVMGTSQAHTSWYIAQGDTTGGHMEALELANPSPQSATVQVVYYVGSNSTPIIKQFVVPANAQVTLDPAIHVGLNQLFGVAVYATLPIVVEQTMFYNVQGASGGYACVGFGQG